MNFGHVENFGLIALIARALIQDGYKYLPFFKKKEERQFTLFIHRTQEEIQEKVKEIEDKVAAIYDENNRRVHEFETLRNNQITNYAVLKENMADLKDRLEKSYTTLDRKIDELKNIMLKPK